MVNIEQLLSTLHADLCKKLAEKLQGEEVTAADLNVIRQFLKDNGIDATPRGSRPLHDLIKALPTDFPGDDE